MTWGWKQKEILVLIVRRNGPVPNTLAYTRGKSTNIHAYASSHIEVSLDNHRKSHKNSLNDLKNKQRECSSAIKYF